jgi:hypothetical protein
MVPIHLVSANQLNPRLLQLNFSLLLQNVVWNTRATGWEVYNLMNIHQFLIVLWVPDFKLVCYLSVQTPICILEIQRGLILEN